MNYNVQKKEIVPSQSRLAFVLGIGQLLLEELTISNNLLTAVSSKFSSLKQLVEVARALC